jgi:iron complex outermembrane recepter protein
MVSARHAVAAIASAARSAFTTDSRSLRASTVGVLCALTFSVTWSGHALGADTSANAAADTSAQAQGTAQPGASQGTAAQPVLEEVTVTGSRIRRKDLTSSSPLVTIDAAQLENHAGLNIEQYLNELPQYNPAETPVTENEDVQPSAVNTVGISTISLRGFGPNRSLVLIDGHRTTPINALMVTDINSIPSSMIDHVEIITGGASAVYGADAIGGVTNFITKKDYEGAQIDVQDGETQAGDGNELRVSGLMGTRFSDGKGNLITGIEYYNRNAAYQRNRSFFTDGWADPNSTQFSSNALFVQGYNGFENGIGAPSVPAMLTLFPGRAAASAANPGSGVCGFASGCFLNTFGFNNDGSIFFGPSPIAQSGFTGPINDPAANGYALENALDAAYPNNAAAPPPPEIQNLKWNNPLATISEPQTRYSFFANGTYDVTDNVQFYMDSRFAESLTTTLLDTPTTSIFGWEASVPYNAATDSPINPALITSATTQAALTAIYNEFKDNPSCASVTCNPDWNPGFKAAGTAGAQHPVPWQLALLLDSRGITPGGVPPAVQFGGLTATLFGGPVTCNNTVAANLNADCVGGANYAPSSPFSAGENASSWILSYLPQDTAPQRSTVDQSNVWQIDSGFRFPLPFGDWTGDLYYSRGQALDYEVGLGNLSLERFRSVIDSPDYGMNQIFQGNANGASTFFGTSVPTTCSSGYYDAIFYNAMPSANCLNAVGSELQTYTAMEQDDTEANFNGTLFKLPAGDVSAAVGLEFRRDAGQFQPDNLQSTYSFLDQSIGLYPLGTLNNEIIDKDGYAEVFLPLISDVAFVQKLSLDIGGRYSSFSNGIPDAKTFKISPDWQVTKSFRIRGGYNHAVRAPNLGELYLGEQEYFGAGAIFGDPCSVRSPAPFGAGGAAPDYSTSGTPWSVADPHGSPTTVASGSTAAHAESTYLICLAQMGGTPPTVASPGSGAAGAYYTTSNLFSQGALGQAAAFAWLNEEGNPNLTSETANTWTAGFVFSNLGDNPWIAGLNGSVDWWQIDIDHAIELDSPDYANYLCYGSVTVTTAAQAAAQAATQACQNVARSLATGAETTALLQYDNLATIGTAGVDIQLNWLAQLEDLGLKGVPGAISFNTQDTILDYYKTKQSGEGFDTDINWKGSLGPNLAGTNGGAYSFRLTSSIGYVLPSWSVNLRWRFLPSVNSYAKAEQQALIANNEAVAAGAKGEILSWTPNEDIAAPAWYVFDLSGTWTINKIFQIRGGVDNLFNKQPAISSLPFLGGGANGGYPVSKPLTSYCKNEPPGCVDPTAYVQPTDGQGATDAGFYDVYGRTFFLGIKASF